MAEAAASCTVTVVVGSAVTGPVALRTQYVDRLI